MTTKTTPLRNMTPSWDLFKPSINLVREHYVGVIYLLLLPSLVAALGSLLVGSPTIDNKTIQLTSTQTTGLVLLLVSALWQIINIGPLTWFQLKAVDNKPYTLGECYSQGLRYTLRLVGYYIVFFVLAIGGLLLFIVPGLFVIRRYFLGNYYLVDKNLRIGATLGQSAKQSKPYSGAIWGVIGVQIALIFLTAFVEGMFSYLGIILGELIACSYVFLSVLRYREIEPRTTAKKA